MANKTPKRARIDAPATASAATTPVSAAAAARAAATKDAANGGATNRKSTTTTPPTPSPNPKRRRAAKTTAADAAVDTDAAQLRTELEAAQKCIEQLRREKDYERRQVREEEQAKSATALRELAARLEAERRRDVDGVREMMRARQEAEAARVARAHEAAVRRLREDVERCRAELRDEIEKRGLSTSTRAAFDAERARLIEKVADLGAAKRRLEEALQSATEADKQKTAEMRRLQEASKQEVARVSKDANAEIRRLLEELKAKDHQLALLDRNQYPDRGASLGKYPYDGLCRDPESCATRSPRATPTAAVERISNDSEILSTLRAEVDRLTGQLAASDADKTVLKARLEELRIELALRDDKIAKLQSIITQGSDKCAEMVLDQQELKEGILAQLKPQPKAVRFLLPGCTLPVLAREQPSQPADDDETNSLSSEMSDLTSLSSSISSSILSPDTTTLCEENLEKNYHMLLTEHLALQRSVALLLTSWTSSVKPPSSSNTPAEATEKQSTCGEECQIKQESLKAAVETLKDKLTMCEETEDNLRQQLLEQTEQNEELEFRMLELEECVEKCKAAHGDTAANDLHEKNRRLEEELLTLKEQIIRCQAAAETVEVQKIVDASSAPPPAEVTELDRASTSWLLENAVAGVTHDLLDDDKFNVMTCSISSATSGFDDNSCASSVADMRLDDMPSEETWGFDVDEYSSGIGVVDVREMAASTPIEIYRAEVVQPSDVPLQQQLAIRSATVDVIPATEDDQLTERHSSVGDDDDAASPPSRQETTERMLASRVEKLEKRLVQAMEGEQRALDRLALLSEEKDRRIAALEDEVDLLEANEFRLSKTIETLEQLERAFSKHFLVSSTSIGSETATCRSGTPSTVCSPGLEEASATYDYLDKVVSHLKDGDLPPSDEVDGGLGHPCADPDSCTQCRACQTLKTTIDQLHAAQRQHDACEKRIKELEAQERQPESAASGSDDDDDATPQVIDFEAEYRELEVLVRELKKVLVDEKGRAVDDGCTLQLPTRAATRMTCAAMSDDGCSAMSSLTVDAQGGYNWNLVDDDTFSMPATPSDELDSPSLVGLSERNRELEITEQYLQQQINDLETERRQLREIVHNNESTIRDLDIHVVELQASEDSLKQDVSRLRAKEDWMNRRIDDLMELVSRLEDAVNGHRATESELRSRLERHQTLETDLGRELENAVEELRASEARYRRWIGQLEEERDGLVGRVDDLTDRNVELESREAALACRIRKMEVVAIGLRSEIGELERALNGCRGEVCEEQLLMLQEFKAERDSHEENRRRGQQEELRRLKDLAVIMRQSLESSKRSNASLEAKLADCTANEQVLRGTIAEYEKIDRIWTEKVEALETTNRELSDKIHDLESKLASVEFNNAARFGTNKDDSKTTNNVDDKMSINYQDSFTAALKSIMLLNDVADEVDDTELVYWAAVECPVAGGDDVADVDVTSPFWDDVEKRMGLKTDKATPETSVSTITLNVSKPEVEKPMPAAAAADHQSTPADVVDSLHQQPPPLPLSPPPVDAVHLPKEAPKLAVSRADVEVRVEADSRPEEKSNSVDGGRLFVVRTSLTTGTQADKTSPTSRSRSADIFAFPSREDRARSASETRETSTAAVASKKDVPAAAASVESLTTTTNEEDKQSTTLTDGAQKSLTSIRERSNKVRKFWEVMEKQSSGQTPKLQLNTPERPNSIRPSLIPRSAVRQTSLTEDGASSNGLTSPRSPVSMPVIRPAHTLTGVNRSADKDRKTRSPYTTVLAPNRSFLPRPVNDTVFMKSLDDNNDKADDTPKTKVTQSSPNEQTTSPKSSYPFVSFTSPKARSNAKDDVIQSPGSTSYPPVSAGGRRE